MAEATRKAFVYCRVSTLEQSSDTATSLKDQAGRCTAYVTSQGWTVAEVFTDPGVSGGKALADRPAGAEMPGRLQAGEASAVVVLKVDRFTRSLADSQTLDEWKTQGVAFVSVVEAFDTSQPTGVLMLDLLQVFAKFERQRIAERNADGRRAITLDERYHDENGHVWRWTGGNLPLGYSTVDKRIVIDPDQAEAVRRIFELRGLRWSTPRIADQLTLEGRRTRPKFRGSGQPEAKPFGSEIIMSILDRSRRHYLGEGIERRLTKDEAPTLYAAPAIVTNEAFLRASAAVIPTLTTNNSPATPSGYPWALARHIEHVHADGSIHSMFRVARASKLPDGKSIKRRWYRCSAAREGLGKCDGFGIVQAKVMTAVSADFVEATVLRWILEQTTEDWQRQIDEAERVESASIDLQDAHRRLTKLESRRAGYLTQEADGLMSRETLIAKLADHDAEAANLSDAIDAEEARQAGAATLRIGIADLLDMHIEWTAEGQEAQDETEDAARRDLALNADYVLNTKPDVYGRIPVLPDAVVEEFRRMVAALGLRVRVAASDSPRRPEVSVRNVLTSNQAMRMQRTVKSDDGMDH
jgi:DNA invertase Pin-like site-specific DNA recombinase